MSKINEIIQDLEMIYKTAIKSNDFKSAISAKKAIASILLKKKEQNDILSLNDLTEEQLISLLKESENENYF